MAIDIAKETAHLADRILGECQCSDCKKEAAMLFGLAAVFAARGHHLDSMYQVVMAQVVLNWEVIDGMCREKRLPVQ